MFLSLILLLTFSIPSIQPQATTGVVNASDGVPIHYAVQGKGEPALVFIHCWSSDRNLWENQVSEFAKSHRVVTLDLPGHGQSGQGRKNWSIESFGDDVKTVVTKLDLKHIVLVGSSMGGPIALEATRRMPERVKAIVPVDTLKNVEDRAPADQLEAVMKQLRTDFKGSIAALMNQYFFSSNTPAAVKTRVISEATSRPQEMAITILQAALSHDASPALREIKVPIRAINGDVSATNLPVNRKYAPQFDEVVMKGVGHYPMLEDPARFNQLLAEILRSLRRDSK